VTKPAQRLGQHEHVSGPRAGIRQHLLWVHSARDRQSVLQLLINDRVPTNEGRPRFVNLVLATTQDLGQDLDRERVDWKSDDAECGQRLTPMAHIRERVGGSDLTVVGSSR
jgi:hypothetical protein